ncbi:GntR family transcriptional regulator [Actinomadura kijaniata]|uniref:GntR family transcriptional regulator n=1 Tax=Actinomadura kijaniata TaxID=46161 RepID=UPI003F1CF092
MAQGRRARWRDIADDLLRRIREDDFPPDGSGRRRLPSELELQETYTASRNAVRDALSWLAGRGHVVSEQGKGTFVVFRSEPFHVTLSASQPGEGPGGGEGEHYRRDAVVQGREWESSEVEVGITTASTVIAWYLQIPEGTAIISRKQHHLIDNEPWSLQISYYPLSFAREGAPRLLEPTDIPEGAVRYLGKTLGYREVGYHDEIQARVPTDEEKRLFGLGEAASDVVLKTIRTAYSRDGQAFRLTETTWPADRNRLHYDLGKVPERIRQAPAATSDGDRGRDLPGDGGK